MNSNYAPIQQRQTRPHVVAESVQVLQIILLDVRQDYSIKALVVPIDIR